MYNENRLFHKAALNKKKKYNTFIDMKLKEKLYTGITNGIMMHSMECK